MADAAQALKSVDWLLRKVAQRHARPGAEIDDLWQECRIALVEALPKFDPRLSSLTTFATETATYTIWRYFRDRVALIRKPAWRWEMGDREDMAAQTAEEWDCPHDPRGSIDSDIYVEQILAALTGRQREVMRLHLAGFNDSEIARRLGLHHCYVWRVRKDVRNLLRNEVTP